MSKQHFQTRNQNEQIEDKKQQRFRQEFEQFRTCDTAQKYTCHRRQKQVKLNGVFGKIYPCARKAQRQHNEYRRGVRPPFVKSADYAENRHGEHSAARPKQPVDDADKRAEKRIKNEFFRPFFVRRFFDFFDAVAVYEISCRLVYTRICRPLKRI